MPKQIFYNEDQIVEKFEKLSNAKKVKVLDVALLYMQQANWRSRTSCIASAMGFKNHIGQPDTYELDNQ